MAYRHIPVMLNEAIHYLNCRPGKTYTDCTLGGSGHARAICERISPDGLFIGIDQDSDAIANAQKTLQPYSSKAKKANTLQSEGVNPLFFVPESDCNI